MRAVILAAGTEIGKTHVAVALLAAARARGLSVRAAKPVMSGYDPQAPAASDAGRLAAACGLGPDAIDGVCLRAFAPPLAPNVAARREGVTLTRAMLTAFARAALAPGPDFALVEGAGGVLSPLADDCLNADLAADLATPVILATAGYLGAVSHTLTALEACANRGVRVAALAISQPSPAYDAPAGLGDELARWSAIPAHLFPYAAPGDAAGLLRRLGGPPGAVAAGR